MAYTITLSDDDYAALAAEAQRTGESIETLVRAAVRARYRSTTRPLPRRRVQRNCSRSTTRWSAWPPLTRAKAVWSNCGSSAA